MPNACASSKIPTIMDVFDLDFGDSKVKIENELVRDELVELNGFERAVENFSRSRRVSECSSRASSASSRTSIYPWLAQPDQDRRWQKKGRENRPRATFYIF